MTPLVAYLLLSCALFAVGLSTVLARRNAILTLIGLELMLNAANLNFIAFWRFHAPADETRGVIFVLFSLAVAAAEAALGLALIIAIYRQRRATTLDTLNSLKG